MTQNQKMNHQEIRAAAIQAAAHLVTTTGAEDAMETAKIFESYIKSGAGPLAPEEQQAEESPEQGLAREGQTAQSRTEIENIQVRAKAQGLLQHSVALGEWKGTLRDALAHYWKQLPPSPNQGLRSELGL